MSIVSSEIKMYRSSVVSDNAANGGIMSANEAVSGVFANLFPNASALERANGAISYRKMFMKVANAANSALLNPRIWQDTNTAGMDSVIFFAGSQRNTQSAITGLEDVYGMGILAPGASIGAQTLSVEVEDGDVPIFKNGRLIRISNRVNPLAAGDEVWARIDQAPVVNGDVVSLHIDTPLPVTFLSGAKVSSVLEASTVEATITAPSPSSALGTIAGVWADKATVNGIGTIEQSWTLTFTSASVFTIAGDTLGEVGAGNIAGAAPLNPAFGSPYFTLLSSLFGGTFAEGDTVTFATHPSAVPLWLRRTIPAGTTASGNNSASFYVDGETT